MALTKKLNLNTIRIDGGTQARVEINNQVVADYAEGIRAGIEFPPIVVFHDGADHWLADGFHRFHAHRHADKASILAEIRDGAVRDATLYSLGANRDHGLQRSNADKRKCVETMLRDPEWAKWSDSKIAKVVAVDHKTVAAHRESILGNSQDTKPAVRTVERAGKTYQQDTSSIGKSAAKIPPAPKRTLDAKPDEVQAVTDNDQIVEAQNTINELAQENEQLRDKLAVEAMDTSETGKTQAAETIKELRSLVKSLEAELDAVKKARNTLMVENGELKKQVASWRKKAEKVAA